MCEKIFKADKNQNTIFFNSYLCKFSICSNPRNVVFIKMWLHWISGCWNKSKTSKVTYCRYKYLYTCYQLVGVVKGWLQGFFFFFKVTMSDHCSLDVVWERCHNYARYFFMENTDIHKTFFNFLYIFFSYLMFLKEPLVNFFILFFCNVNHCLEGKYAQFL